MAFDDMCESLAETYLVKTLIPNMTSNTTPSGSVTYSSQFSTAYPAWALFSSNYKYCSGNEENPWVQYAFDTPIRALSCSIFQDNYETSLNVALNVKVLASNDNVNFDEVQPWVTLSLGVNNFSVNTNKVYYKYYRFQFTRMWKSTSCCTFVNRTTIYGLVQH